MSARLVRINGKSRSLDVDALSFVFVYEKAKGWLCLRVWGTLNERI